EEHASSTVAGEREYAFTHALIPEVAYATLSKTMRSAKHLRFAGWLEGVAHYADEFLEVLAHHYEDAWRYRFETGEEAQDTARKAIHTIRRASARAKARWTLPEARRLCDRALRILHTAGLDTDVPLLLELLTDRCEVVKWLDVPDVVFEDTQRIVDAAGAAGREDLLARAWLNRAFAANDRGRLHEAEDALQRAETLFRSLGDRQLARQSHERISEAGAVVGLAIVAHLTGKPAAAVDRYQEAIAIYLELGDLMGAASAHRHLGMHHLRMGAVDEADAALQRARALRAEYGARSESAVILRGLAEASLARGNLLQAAEYAEKAMRAVSDFDQLAKATHGVT